MNNKKHCGESRSGSHIFHGYSAVEPGSIYP